jgi:hypothetical protein
MSPLGLLRCPQGVDTQAAVRFITSRVHFETVKSATSDRIHFLEALNGPSVMAVVWQDDDVSWRKIAYYFPSYPTWGLEGLSGSSSRRRPLLWLHRHLERAAEGDETYPILVPDRGQLAWLLHPYSPLPPDLKSQGVPLCQFGTMFLTDLKRAPPALSCGAVCIPEGQSRGATAKRLIPVE